MLHPQYIGDGECDDNCVFKTLPKEARYNVEECGWDGGDCKKYDEIYPDCKGCFDGLNNTLCDEVNNNEECGWDAGDCDTTS